MGDHYAASTADDAGKSKTLYDSAINRYIDLYFRYPGKFF